MLLSVFIYGFIMYIMVCCGVLTNRKAYHRKNLYKTPIICAILLFAIVFGLRYNVGADYPTYLEHYESALNGFAGIRDDFEKGFQFLVSIFTSLGLQSYVFFAFFSLIQISFLYLAFNNERVIYPYIAFILMTGPFIGWMNVMRQNTAFCIFVWLINTIKDRNMFSYSFAILLCSYFFHKSALILLPLYPLLRRYKLDLTSSIKIQLLVIFVAIYINYRQLFVPYMQNIDSILILMGYGDRFAGRELITEFQVEHSWGGRSLISISLVLFTILYSTKIKKRFENTQIIWFYNFFLWGTVFHLIFTGVHIFQRITEYFSYMSLIIYSYTLLYLNEEKSKSTIKFLFFLCYIMLNVLTFCGLIYSTNDPEAYTKFYFIWDRP